MSLNPEVQRASELEKTYERIRYDMPHDRLPSTYTVAERITGTPGAEYHIEHQRNKRGKFFHALVSAPSGDEYLIFTRPGDVSTRPGRACVVNGRYSPDGTLDNFLYFQLEEGDPLPPIEFGKPWKLRGSSHSLETPPIESVLVGGVERAIPVHHKATEPYPFLKYTPLVDGMTQVSRSNPHTRT